MENQNTKQIIYNDCNTLINLIHSLSENPIVGVQITPFISLFCTEALNYCAKYNIKIALPQNNSFSVDDIRLKLKLFENKYSKARKMIENCDYLQDYIFRHQLRFNFTKSWNIHYNLGVIFDENNNIVGNSQYGYYVFQDSRLLKKKIEEVERLTDTKGVKFEYSPAEIRSYGVFCGQILREIANTFREHRLIDHKIKSSSFRVPLLYKDYNTNKHFSSIYKSNADKPLFLYILHILSFVNFSTKLLGRFEKADYGWWLRHYYITYHYVLKRLEDIKNYLDNNHSGLVDIAHLIERTLPINGNKFSNTTFRNCMMHYDLNDSAGDFLIATEYQNPNTPLFGLVESCFNGTHYTQLKSEILSELSRISEELSRWLKIPQNNKTRF